ncbi:MAG: beta strand repeat-containing protein [Terriglobales bacterium]
MAGRKNWWNGLLVVAALSSLLACGGLGGKQQTQGPGQLSASPSSLNFGNVQTGTSQSLNDTVTNTGQASLTISQITVTGTGYSITGISAPLTLAPGQGAGFSVQLAPTAVGAISGNIAFVTDNGTVNIPLSGTGVEAGTLTANPTSLNFGTVAIGSAASQTVTLKNTGGGNVTVTAASVTGAGFSDSGLSLPLTLTPNQSSTFSVSFAPTGTGAVTGNVALTVSGQAELDIALSGQGVSPATLTANPTSLTFTNVTVGQSSTQTETIKNTGGTSATITAVTPTGTGFSVSGITLPATVGAGQSVTFNVKFAPQSPGTFSGNVAVISNAQNPSLNIPLSGTAVAAGDLTASPTSISFGNVILGDAMSQIVTLKNTGGQNVTVTAASISGAGMSYSGLTMPLTLTPNQSSTFSVTFEPTVAGAVNGTMSLTVSGSANISIPLSGTGVTPATLTANPTSLTFTNIQVGTNSTQSDTIKNTGGASATITAVTPTGTGFSVSGITLPVTVAAGQSVSFNVTFAPQSPGTFSGNVAVISNAQNPTLNVPLSGAAVGAQGTLGVTNPINVGNVVQGTSGTATGTLTASAANVVVSSVSLSGANPAEFAISGLNFPVTVTVGTPVSFTVTFSPTATGSASATASFVSNASNSPTSAALSGNGTPQPVHTVQLAWIASITQGITSYNVYRAVYSGTTCGTYSSIGSTSGSVTTFTDSNVTDGTTYCYATTSVDSSGESGYSNIAQAQIPPP